MQQKSFEQVLADYEPLIKSQIKKLNVYKQHDEYYHVGVIALWEAYRKFDQEKGSFSAYALHTVRGHMLMHLRKERRFSDRHTLQDEQVSAVFHRPDPRLVYDLDYAMLKLEPYLKPLSPRERLWLKETMLYEKKLGEIAEEQNVSKHTVSSWRKTALKKLRKIVHLFEE